MIIEFKKQKGFIIEIDLEKSKSFNEIEVVSDSLLLDILKFSDFEKKGWDSLKHRMYFLNCLCSFNPEKGLTFSYYESDINNSSLPCLYQTDKDNPIELGVPLIFDKTIIPLAYQSLEKSQFTVDVCSDICTKYFERINRKYFDYISKEEPQNDIIVTVEQVNKTIVTAVETMPVVEPKQTEQPTQSTGIENTITYQFKLFSDLKNEANEKIKILNNPKISTSDLANQNSLFCDIITKVGDLKSSIEDVICDSDNDLDALLIEQKENFAQLCVSKNEKYTTAGADAYSEAQTISDRSFLKKFKAFKSNVDTFYKDLSRKFSAIVQIISERKQTRNLNE